LKIDRRGFVDSGRVSIKIDVDQAFMLERRRVRAPVSFDVVKEGMEIEASNGLKEQSKALSVGIRPYKLNHMRVAQLFEDLHLLQVLLPYLPSQRDSLPRKLEAQDFCFVDITHCTSAEEGLWP
jgi:hypothetical protein